MYTYFWPQDIQQHKGRAVVVGELDRSYRGLLFGLGCSVVIRFISSYLGCLRAEHKEKEKSRIAAVVVFAAVIMDKK